MQILRKYGVHMYNLDLLIAVRAYCQFIRPTLEFAIALIDITYNQKHELEKAQKLCLKFYLNHSAKSIASTAIIEYMCNIPTIMTRYNILQFKFLTRIHSLTPGLLTANIISSLLSQRTKHRKRACLKRKNILWITLQGTKSIYQFNMNPPLGSEIEKHIQDYKEEQHNLRHQTPNKKIIKKIRNDKKPKVDPILFIPCSHKERIRLIKWRLGSLPYVYKAQFGCKCGNRSTNTYHYFLSCNLLIDDLEYLDYIIKNYFPAYTIIDLLLNSISQSFNLMHKYHWKHT